MDATQKDSLAVSSRPSQEKDFPYFRRLFNSIVVALLAASFIPLLVIGGGMYYHTVSILEQKTLAALDAEISEHREAIDQFLTERTMDLKLLSSNLGFDYLTAPGNLKRAFDTLQKQLPCFSDMGVIDDQGRHRAYVGPYDLLSKNYKDTPWFKAIQQREFYVSDVFMGFRNDPHFIIAVKQTTNEGFWVLRATVDTGYFEGLVAEVLSKRDGDAYVVNKDGIFQTTPRWGGKIMGQSEVKYMEPFKGVRLEERGGKIVMTAWLERAPWLCVAEFKREDIYSPLRNIRNVGILVFVLGAMLIVLTVILTTNYLFSRLETKRRNIRFLDHQLQHSNKMASSMKLASGFVREVNETLSNIDLVLSWVDDLAQGDLSGEESRTEVRESLKQVRSELVRARRATDRFLKSTQASLPIIREVRVQDLLDEIVELLDGELHFNSITIKREYQDPIPPVQSDPSQLRQIFQNLIVNALTAIGQDGVITLSVQGAEEKVSVSVGDTGPGIPKGKLDEIFDPLFTSTPDRTGLGLAIGAGVLKKLGGKISVKSEIGKGSVFTVEIPTRFSPPEA
jgi:two-component system, NtrC family, sensor kinase